MSQLYPRIFSSERLDRRMVATCVGGELHEIGVRMVADFFEMEGWDTYYLGANTPTTSILQALDDRNADILAISATMTFHVSQVRQLIDAVRASDSGRDIGILVGGYPFNHSANLWRRVGADGFATHAQEAVQRANELLAS
jgi:methanogenic corrinoid protein MtbC1